jgi:hypothetical protein
MGHFVEKRTIHAVKTGSHAAVARTLAERLFLLPPHLSFR